MKTSVLEEILAEGYVVNIKKSEQTTPPIYVVGLNNKWFGLENTVDLALTEAYSKIKAAEALVEVQMNAKREAEEKATNPFAKPPKVNFDG